MYLLSVPLGKHSHLRNTCQLLYTVSAGELSKLLVNPCSWSSVSGDTGVEINVIVQLMKHNVPES